MCTLIITIIIRFTQSYYFFFFFFSSRRRHTRCREVSWARRCVQETGIDISINPQHDKLYYQTHLNKERESLQNSIAALKIENEYLRSQCSSSLPEKAPEEKNNNRKLFNLAIILLLFFVCILLLLKN
eukprot:TRINITY_DN8417_c0_g1_i1.p2 TRINITY_DN8417_c0_g1~~TRINITY_DN8417_c0_g1_i1.p2  ORF type:complete len:128 (-),score=38.84 TRINITY_DN8417_c0_g1_i1:18-401(-)